MLLSNYRKFVTLPINWDLDFPDLTKDHLKVALNAVEFGDELASPTILLNVSGDKMEIQSLSALIKFILELRYRSDLMPAQRIEFFKLLRIQAADRFSSSFLAVITLKEITYPKKGTRDLK